DPSTNLHGSASAERRQPSDGVICTVRRIGSTGIDPAPCSDKAFFLSSAEVSGLSLRVAHGEDDDRVTSNAVDDHIGKRLDDVVTIAPVVENGPAFGSLMDLRHSGTDHVAKAAGDFY